MTTISYDFSEAGEGGDFVTLREGRYVFKLVKVEGGKSGQGNPKAIVTLAVAAPEGAFVDGLINQHWPTTGAGAFRFRALLKALGVSGKEKGKVNLAKYYGKEIGARVTLSEGRPRDDGTAMLFHELNGIVPGSQMRAVLGDEEGDEDEDFEDEYSDEEETEEESSEEEADEDDEAEDDDEDITPDDVREMDLTELKELAEEWGISTKPPKGKSRLSKAVMVKRILEEFEDDEDDEEDEDEEPF